jgi:multiple antibiotic resistance protein
VDVFWLCFLPLLVAVDAIGIVPLFIALTERVARAQRRRIIGQSVLTATAVALAFVFGGSAFLRLLGITVADFMVAGGTLLFVFSLSDLIVPQRASGLEADGVGAVPLGVPLLAGPAVLTTSILLVDQYGRLATAVAVVTNMILAGITLRFADLLHRLLGATGTRVVQRVMLLLLAAIAVMTVRKGVEAFLRAAPPG